MIGKRNDVPLPQQPLRPDGHLSYPDFRSVFAWAWSRADGLPDMEKSELYDHAVRAYYDGHLIRFPTDPWAEIIAQNAVAAAQREMRNIRNHQPDHPMFVGFEISTHPRRCCDLVKPMAGKFCTSEKRPRFPLDDCDADVCQCRAEVLTKRALDAAIKKLWL